MKGIAAKVGGALAFLLLCALLFDVPSAYAVAAGKPRWVAWTVGALALAVPIAWNIFGERSRAAATKPTTSRTERIWLRTGFVALLVIGGLFGMARGKAWRAVRHHALWFVPYTPAPLDTTSPLLVRVPSAATAVIWLRDTDASRATLGQFTPVDSGEFELVAAFDSAGHAIVMERGDVGIVDKIAELAKVVGQFAKLDFSAARSLPDGTRVWSTAGWGVSSSPPTALLDRMRGADDDAFLIGVMEDQKRHEVGLVWLGGHDDELHAVAEVTAPNEAEAKRFVDGVDRELTAKAKQVACWTNSGGASSLVRDGATIRAFASIQATEIAGVLLCLELKK
jgi:hypothetical protein